MKEKLIKFLLDQTFIYDFSINEILNRFFPKEKPIFYADQICSEKNFLQKLYLIKDVFHRQLKKHNQIFYINHKYIKFELSDYFYLSSLISDEPDSINYNYDYNLIISIDNKNKSSENSLKKAMISKIIIDLINNFKNIKDNEQKYGKELNEIEKKNKEIIVANINEFKVNINVGDIISMKIDDIYIKVIESIIQSDNFEDIEKIFSQLSLDVIKITNINFKELEIITKKENYIISEIHDLFDNEKINYYYILVKYIFKTTSSINNINLLKNFQAFLIKIITSQLYELYFNYIDNEAIYEKRNYVVKYILNNEYYYQKYSETIKLIELINYYKKSSNESNKEKIKSIEMIFRNNKLNKKYEFEYSNIQIIKYLFKKHKFKNLKESKEKRIFIKKQNNKKGLKELAGYDDLLINNLRDDFNKEIFVRIFTKDIYQYYNKEISNIKTIVNNQNTNVHYIDSNKENNGNLNIDNSITQIRNSPKYYKLFCESLFCSLNDEECSIDLFSYFIVKKKNIVYEKIVFDRNNIIFDDKSIKQIIYWLGKADENDNLIKNSKKIFKGLNDIKELFLKKLNDEFKIKFIFKREKDLSDKSFFNISFECYYITTTRDLILAMPNVLNNGMNKENKISKINSHNNRVKEENPPIIFNIKSIRKNNNPEDINDSINSSNLIPIDENLYALLTEERDLIIHWNTGKKFKIVGYSIEITNNKLYMIQKSYKNNDRVLLCCCKNQIKEKNGILFIEIDKKETETFNYIITDFKVECMCLLNISDDFIRNNSIYNERNNNWANNNLNNSKKYHFLLLGGYDIREHKPSAKLYQILIDESNNEKNDRITMENVNGIILLELPDATLSQLNFDSNIININQKENENEITIITKENIYYLSFEIYPYSCKN